MTSCLQNGDVIKIAAILSEVKQKQTIKPNAIQCDSAINVILILLPVQTSGDFSAFWAGRPRDFCLVYSFQTVTKL